MATVRCIDDARGVSVVRVLVVEDFEPFRRFICSKLGENPELLVIGEASDGLEAVCKAEELQPDLVLLDIGLPKLNGIVSCHPHFVASSTPNIVAALRTLAATPKSPLEIWGCSSANFSRRIPTASRCPTS